MVEISEKRYSELIRAEHVADQMKELVRERVDHYQGLSHAEIRLIKTIWFGYEKEEEE